MSENIRAWLGIFMMIIIAGGIGFVTHLFLE